ncbi:MAG: hypothetical protein LC750_01495 [Actinobacteria bacterium]|nr:hypothetical protein [Actinomycetota bacterium]
MRRVTSLLLAVALSMVLMVSLAAPAGANHSWGGYHWARTANPFTLRLGDNVTSTWDPILATTSSDWSRSTVLDTTIVAGSVTNPKNCKATLGRVEVCNAKYGYNGWLGIAQIWLQSGSTHIVQGVVKLNDSYFNTSTYNSTAWRNLVSCQEVAHTFGLDHQDENFDNPNLGTCMDYTNDPSTNQHPNQHDYDELVTIYNHLDSSTTIGQATTSSPGRSHESVSSTRTSDGYTVITWTWHA